jgi:hypothetical protein
VYNNWSSKSAALLAKLDPGRFPVLSNATINTNWPVAATFSTTYIADPYGKLTMMMKPKPKPKPKAAAPGKAGAKGAAGEAAKGAAGEAAAPKDDKGAKAAPKAKGGK